MEENLEDMSIKYLNGMKNYRILKKERIQKELDTGDGYTVERDENSIPIGVKKSKSGPLSEDINRDSLENVNSEISDLNQELDRR